MVDPIGITVSWIAGRLLQKTSDAAVTRIRDAVGRSEVDRALVSVLRQAVETATGQVYVDDPGRARHIRDLLLERPEEAWPLVDGTDPVDLGAAVRRWVSEVFRPVGSGVLSEGVEDEHPLTVRLCEAILGAIHQEATRGPGVLHRLWSDFCLRELGVELGQITVQGATSVRQADAGSHVDLRPVLRPWWDPPLTTAGFVGRQDTLIRLDDSLASESAATGGAADGTPAARTGAMGLVCAVDGISGVGKTALVVAYAERVADRYPDGRVFLDFNSYSQERPPLSAEQALRTVLERVCPRLSREEVNTLDRDRLRAAWRDAVEGRRVLMVWDNVAEAAQIEPLLIRQDGCTTIVTSRTRLDLPQSLRVRLDVMTPVDAASLFSRIAGPEHAVDRDLVARLVAADAYMPVLIEQHAKTLTVAGTMTSTAEAVRELETLPKGRTRRALYARLEWSYRRLDADQRYAFRVMGAHPGRVMTALSAAEVMACEIDEAVELLNGLIAAGMAQRHRIEAADSSSERGAAAEAGRRELYAYTAHDVILEFAAHLAAQDPDEHRATRTALRHSYQRLLDCYTEADLPWLSAEHPQIAAVALAGHDAAHGRLAAALGHRLFNTGRFAAGETIYRHAAEVYRALGDRGGYGDALLALGDVVRVQGRYAEACALFRQAADMSQGIGNPSGHAYALRGLADSVRVQGDYAEAEALFRRAADISRSIGESRELGNALRGLGDVTRVQGRYAEAESLYLQSAETFQGIADRSGHAFAVRGLGDVARVQGRYADAESLYRQAADTFLEIGERLGYGNAVCGLGDVARMQGRYTEAESLYRRAAETFQAIGQRRGHAFTLRGLGDVARVQGRYADAESLYRQAADTYQAIGNPGGCADAFRALADLARAQGRYTDAESLYGQAAEIYQTIGDRLSRANALEGLAEVAVGRGSQENACDLFRRALTIYAELGVAGVDHVRRRLVELGCDDRDSDV